MTGLLATVMSLSMANYVIAAICDQKTMMKVCCGGWMLSNALMVEIDCLKGDPGCIPYGLLSMAVVLLLTMAVTDGGSLAREVATIIGVRKIRRNSAETLKNP